jgi:hypothetical protein
VTEQESQYYKKKKQRKIDRQKIAAGLGILLVLLVGAGNLWNEYYLNGKVTNLVHNQAEEDRKNQQAQQAAQAAQKTAGLLIESKLCASLIPLASLSTLKPPAGDPATNPARAFEQDLVAKLAPLANLASDIHCPVNPLY